ncbi:helix-turn-helix domain-containing protein [Gemella sp. GH3]|uniref:LexA family transcriptional regulator n=1 Tax=unclassified Gemella TaxID=2624949 RepID=UPI0015CF864B|nr:MULTISPECIES: LexA family transcriptional regulator [unclassified Gemella]MBF0714537.1 helix-turn-helix domain-containing protein [Gemella sp. GH3.1]NYS51489.1 helix-turn-helix domain-containing protein [Gemella sp. GH3]
MAKYSPQEIENRKYFAERLNYLSQTNNKKQIDLHRDLGIPKSTLTGYFKGRSLPNPGNLQKIADYFNVLKSELDLRFAEEKFDLIEKNNSTTPKRKGVKIPVLGEVAAGVPIEAIEDIIDYEEITEEMASRGDFFGLKIKGDSMEPAIMNGDVVIVRQQPDAESGDTVIVVVNGDSATCKKIKKHANGLMLIPINPNYETTFYSNEEITTIPIVIIGKVVELRRQF